MESLKSELIELLESHPESYGVDSLLLINDWIAKNGLPAEDVSRAFESLGKEGHQLSDGRIVICGAQYPVHFPLTVEEIKGINDFKAGLTA